MPLLKQNTAYTRMFLMVASADHLTGLTGATVSVSLSKAGGAFASATTSGGGVSEVGNGWYKIALTATDTNTLNDLVFHCTATSGDPSDFADQVVAVDLTDAAAFGLSRVDAAVSSRMATFTLPTNFSSFSIDANGRIKPLTGITKNGGLNNFMFMMTDSATHAPKTGILNASFTKQYSLDGGGFSGLSGTISEIASGWYKINLSVAETNGTVIALRFAAAGADDTDLTLIASQ